MTLTIDLTPDEEATLMNKAALAGLDVSEYALRVLHEASLPTVQDSGETMYDSLKALGVIGIVEGTSGPGDGRSWSEIEAPCDPL
ncbi:MAG: hypothetical protein P4L33_04280 [Capsulimonadaceae bacterium]|nr:hypothetical protein [Capsulimonadaceae bacterium]